MNPKTVRPAVAVSAISVALVAGVLGGGCGTEERPGDEVRETTSQLLTGGWHYTWQQVGSDPPPVLDLGPTSDRTCFLTGVAGNLEASARVRISEDVDGHWKLAVSSYAGLDLKGTVACLPTIAGRTEAVEWTSSEPRHVLGAFTSHRRCFLTSVSNGPGGYFENDEDHVRVWHDSKHWYIGGGGNAAGVARCIDVDSDQGSWLWIAGSGHRTDDLAADSGGVHCLLTGIGGRFISVMTPWDLPALEDGVLIGFEWKGQQWTMSTSRGKRGWATCFK